MGSAMLLITHVANGPNEVNLSQNWMACQNEEVSEFLLTLKT
jgi:hypothetical protein